MTTAIKTDYTVLEYAELVRVSERTVYRWAKDGKIPTRKYGRTIRIRPAALDGFED